METASKVLKGMDQKASRSYVCFMQRLRVVRVCAWVLLLSVVDAAQGQALPSHAVVEMAPQLHRR